MALRSRRSDLGRMAVDMHLPVAACLLLPVELAPCRARQPAHTDARPYTGFQDVCPRCRRPWWSGFAGWSAAPLGAGLASRPVVSTPRNAGYALSSGLASWLSASGDTRCCSSGVVD